MDKLGIMGTVRASLGVYNDEADIDRLAEAVLACREMFSR
jgi:selenocysteine lyase/cysteine desulfurase